MEQVGDATVTLLVGVLGVIGVAMDSEKFRNWLYEYEIEEESLRMSGSK